MFHNCKIVGSNVDARKYHAVNEGLRGKPNFAVSSGSLRLFSDCPAKWVRGFEPKDSRATKWGNLLDTMVLTPDSADANYAVTPDVYSAEVMECPQCKSQTDSKVCRKCGCDRVKVKIEKQWNNAATVCSDWIELQLAAGKEIVSHDEMKAVRDAIARLKEQETLWAFIEQSDHQVQVSGEWHDDATGLVIPVQCLIDLVPKDNSEFASAIGDLKSTYNASPEAWRYYALRKARYHIQAAWNLQMLNQALGQKRNIFCFVVQESDAPYQAEGRKMTDIEGDSSIFSMTYARMFINRQMAKYAQCLKNNNWPGYNETFCNPQLDSQGWKEVEAMPAMEYELQSQAIADEQAERMADIDDVPN